MKERVHPTTISMMTLLPYFSQLSVSFSLCGTCQQDDKLLVYTRLMVEAVESAAAAAAVDFTNCC